MPYAAIELKDPHSPFNIKYGDFYFSRQGPEAESSHVFLMGNRIAQRWIGKESFTIGELGFGSGLNFLNTVRLWLQSPQASDQLHYLAWESDPLAPNTMEEILRPFSELTPLFEELKPQLPPPLPGIYSIDLNGGAIKLILIYGDARKTLPQTCVQVDAWYLDGFAPRVNPELWERSLLYEVAKRTKAGGTVATYSAATQVRLNLTAAGFQVKRCKGFAQKREMLTGYLEKKIPDLDHPWGCPEPRTSGKEVIILGAGLAGSTLAHHLSQKNWEVRVYDRHLIPAAEGSGNRGGILFPYLSLNHEAQSQYFWAGYQFTRNLFRSLRHQGKPIGGSEMGMLILEQKNGDMARWKKYSERYGLPTQWFQLVDAAKASHHAKFPLKRGGVFLPSGTWISPQDFCHSLMQGNGITFVGGKSISRISQKAGYWNVHDASGNIIDQAPWLFLANAMGMTQLLPPRSWGLSPVKGQVTYWQPSPKRIAPQSILCGGSYMIPHSEGRWEMGATFERSIEDLSVRQADHQKNWSPLNEILSGVPEELPESQLSGRVAVRACSKNRWPILGPVHQESGLLVSCAHGSKGLLSAPLGAECLARFLNNEPIPLSMSMMRSLSAPIQENL